MGGVDVNVEKRVGFAGFYGNELSRFVKFLYKELFMWEWNGGKCSWVGRSVIGGTVTDENSWN